MNDISVMYTYEIMICTMFNVYSPITLEEEKQFSMLAIYIYSYFKLCHSEKS